LLLIKLKYVFCSFVAAAGVLFPVNWVFSSVKKAALKQSEIAGFEPRNPFYFILANYDQGMTLGDCSK